MSDNPAPSETDPNLWVEVDGLDGKLFIMGNPHTYPGRITGWSYEGNHSYYFSKDEVTAASDAARYWIDGFLSGNEPTLAEYLGIGPEQAARLDDDDAAIARWHEALHAFCTTGDFPELVLRPVRPFPSESVDGHVPWLVAGGEVWMWVNGAWSVPDPQPERVRTALVGTPCIDEEHELEFDGDYYLACVKCGHAVEVELA